MERLIYTNTKGEQVEFSVHTDYIMRNIDGTGGVDLAIKSNKSYKQDGESYEGNTLEPRFINVELSVVADGREDMAQKRQRLTRTLNPKLDLGTIEYEYGGVRKRVQGIPEKSPNFVPGNRGKDYIQETLITFYCPNPYWQELETERVDVSTLVGGWSFPWEIPAEGYEMSIRTISYITNVYNGGSAKTPILVSLKATGNVTDPIITNNDTGEYIRVNRVLADGDELLIDTKFGNKRVEIIRSNGERENAFHYIDYKSDFFSVASGDNEIEYGAEIGEANLDVYIYYTPRYVGI